MLYFAALSNSSADLETRQQIISRFLQLYEIAGTPEDATLYDVIDSIGHFSGLALNEHTARHVPELLQEFAPWHEMSPPGNLGWAAGAGGPT